MPGRMGLVLAVLLALHTVRAVRVEIEAAERLEIRTITLPNGNMVDLYVLFGSPARLRVDGDLLEAEHLEIDLSQRLVRVIGPGSFVTETESIQGQDLEIVLDDETFSGRDVLIVTSSLDVIGDRASRVPGQISVLAGRFSPCSRCVQDIEDFGFQAERLELFPGDRLIAYDATLLVRGQPLLDFPLLVVPLAPPDRQPRFAITSGTSSSRAQVELTWPYVAGSSGLGSFTVRYLADVSPGSGSFLAENLLGGGVDANYFGGGFDHRFFTATGEGTLALEYTPGFLDPQGPNGPSLPLWRAAFRYATNELIAPPAIHILVERNDAQLDRVIEYSLMTEDVRSGIRGRFESQGFVVLDGGEPDAVPSYAGRSTPLRTVNRLVLNREAGQRLEVGAFYLEALQLDLGIFEDVSNFANRSAAATPRFVAGRALERHVVGFDATAWPGFSLTGRTDFTGKYYDTGERLIDWDTRLDARQTLFGVGRLDLAARRDVNEGETPFRFDQIPLRNRSEVNASLGLDPAAWLSASLAGGYVFEDTRDTEALGLQPLDSDVALFGNLSWIDLGLSNSYDLADDDPGNLEVRLGLRLAGDPSLRASLDIGHTQDFLVTPDRLTGLATDETETTLFARVAAAPYLELDVNGGYTYVPPAATGNEPRAFWQPLEIGLTAGTLGQADVVPGLRVSHTRDLNLGEVTALGYQVSARVGPLEASASQTFDVFNAQLGSSRYDLRWPDVVAFEARGMGLIQPDWLGLPFDDSEAQSWSVSLLDAPSSGRERWRLSYRTVRDPSLAGGSGGFRNSTLEARVVLDETEVDSVRFAVDLSVVYRLADDDLTRSYLRQGSLDLAIDVNGWLGVQGTVGYNGTFNQTLGELTSARLSFTDLTVTVHPIDELYIGAVLEDVWDFTGNVSSQTPFNLQPTLFVTWDRCCWALFASWNTATGEISVALSAPGASEGIRQIFDTALILPGREASP